MSIQSPTTPARAAVSRRRIVQGAAWAAPAVLIATAAPAAATSPVSTDPVIGTVLTGYSPNPGESYQRIAATFSYSDNGATESFVVTSVIVDFVKDGSQNKPGGAEPLDTTIWQLNQSASVFPLAIGAAAKAVFEPITAGTVALSPSQSVSVFEFNLNRFSAITAVTVFGTVGSTVRSFTINP